MKSSSNFLGAFTVTAALLIPVILLSNQTFAQRNSKALLYGQWEMSSRTCSDGSLPQDLFQLGRDSSQVHIAKDRIEFQAKVKGLRVSINRGSLRVTENRLHVLADGGQTLEAQYEFLDSESLRLIVSGFTDRGSCSKGAQLVTTYRRSTNGNVLLAAANELANPMD